MQILEADGVLEPTKLNQIWINDHIYIAILPESAYNLEVWENTTGKIHRMARMDYKYHRDTFAGFIYRLCPDINLMQIHSLQKQINPFFDLEV
ncbi:hypothetical protein FC34_GL001363 [Lacticaseibacillus brantae DSM 23927]|uniref:Uncharacterized protein n=1 Tax=Lacticaseibacillus brantae DSM 23927 TaxID=1423727 RepID=A0A0R2AY85_9LACO|nr:hypothetical protein FC34_GL001363 [Lacticaseibacillus brantae DSM 23927]